MSTPKRTLKQTAYHEFKEFLVIALYLWVVFGLLLLYESVILSQEHIDVVAKAFALLNALALARVMLASRGMGQRRATDLAHTREVRVICGRDPLGERSERPGSSPRPDLLLQLRSRQQPPPQL
jgi:hypothetical protein